MDSAMETAARWLGILTTGLLVGDDAEQSAKVLRRVLGAQALTDLRHWFASVDPAASRDARIAAVEACIAIVRVDREVDAEEREALERIISLSELDDEAQAALAKHIDTDVSLDTIAPRLAHPALREALLAIAWQVARSDGRVQDAEAGIYGVLADKLGVTPTRASELRQALTAR